MKVAIVHDWLTNMGGAEKVVLELSKIYPNAPIYTSVFDKVKMPEFADKDVRTTWLQKLPFRFKHQLWAPLRPLAFRSLDLREYDVVISSSSAEAKQIKVRGDAIHICYCHTPIRYFWSEYDRYKKDPGLGILNIFAPIVMPLFVNPLRRSDKKAAQRVDKFIANSHYIAQQIKKYYDRSAKVINPPVDVARFKPKIQPLRKGYLVVGRLIPYKRVDLAIQACNKLGLDLTVIGRGSEYHKLKDIAGSTIQFLDSVSDEELPFYYQRSKALIFPAKEDFGIVPVESMAAGCPVIAFDGGGSKDYMSSKIGVVFEHQTVDSLVKAIHDFEKKSFNQKDLLAQANKFRPEVFRQEISNFVGRSFKNRV